MTGLDRGWAALGVRRRLTVVYLAILIVLLAALGAYFYAGARDALEESLLRELRAVSAAVRTELDGGSLAPERVSEVVRGTVRGESVVVMDERGSIVAAAGPPLGFDAGSLPFGPATLERSDVTETGGGRRVGWAMAALASHPGHAVVVLAGTSNVDAALGDVGTALLVSLVVAATVGSILIWWATGRALAPVRRLTVASRRMAGGDPSARVDEEPGSDELAELTRAFNVMARRVEESIERQRRFVADASHELRTPLTALVGELDVLERADAATAGELREAMRRQLARVRRLVDDLLTLARLDSLGPAALARRAMDLGGIARDVVEEARHAAGRETAEIRLVVDDVAASVHGDPDALHQALLNLVTNAVRHAGPGGQVTVTVRVDAADVLCEVRDTGPGIPDDQLDAVFTRFRRLAVTDASSPGPAADIAGGSGLGLSIVRAIVESHGGRVTARNDGGALLTVTLPRSTAD